jgi:glycosyltransferase involved in cell wall biosynthesis
MCTPEPKDEHMSTFSVDPPVDGIAHNHRVYRALVDVAEKYVQDRDPEQVLAAAAVAANYAYEAPIGRLGGPRLEGLIVRAVRDGAEAPRVDAGRQAGRVVHVLTNSANIGGHSRLAWRWIERDHRIADLVLTNQTDPVPTELAKAVFASGGRIYDLRTAHTSLLERARAIRQVMDHADIAIYHIHPFDSVAVAAANLPGVRPPVVLENHADHTFWLGLSAADVISDHRELGQQICRELRGVPAERLRLLPLPVEALPQPAERTELRAHLKIADSSVVAVCIASPGKMEPIFGTGMAEVAHQLLTAVPELVLLMVGPPSAGPWAELAQHFPGRLQALGYLADAGVLFAAADLYLDSYPVSGGTSLLEAAAAGLPVISLQETDRYRPVWIAESPGLADPMHRAHNVADYVEQVRRLAATVELRTDRGRTTREAVLAQHHGAGWAAQLEDLYRHVRSLEPVDLVELDTELLADPQFHEELLRFVEWARPRLAFSSSISPYAAVLQPALRAHLYAAWTATKSAGGRVNLRVGEDWDANRAWIVRAMAMTAGNPRFCLSLPPVDGDYATSLETLLSVLTELGLTPESCGNVAVEQTYADPGLTLYLPADALTLDLIASTLSHLGPDPTAAEAIALAVA